MKRGWNVVVKAGRDTKLTSEDREVDPCVNVNAILRLTLVVHLFFSI